MAHPSRRCCSEDGAFLVLWALLLVGLFTMVAIVIDLGALRADRRTDRAAADAAATAGALALQTSSASACQAAIDYAEQNLRLDAGTLTAVGPSCSSLASCSFTGPSKSATYSGKGYTVTVTHPVAAGDPLLVGADAVGGDIPQTGTSIDGGQCDRVGVQVSYTRETIFSKVANVKSNSTTVHSVAVFTLNPGKGRDTPALVALNRTKCKTISAGTGKIIAENNGEKAAIMHADSDGSLCSTSPAEYVLSVKSGSQGDVQALPGTTTEVGQLGYFSPTAVGFRPGAPARYVGTLKKLLERTTRDDVDAVYHCEASTAGCAAGQTDFFKTVLKPYGTGAQPSFQQFTGDCANPQDTFAAGNWYIDCPGVFSVGTGKSVSFGGGGTIIFTGGLAVGGDLRINTTSHESDALTGPTRGVPIASTAVDTLIVVRSSAADAIALQNNGTKLWMARTLVYNVAGGMTVQGGAELRWTPPEGGGGKYLLYWTDATQAHVIIGTPVFRGDGVFVAGNAPLRLQGNAGLDATNVQMWLDSADVQGTGTLRLRPDPDRAIHTGKVAGTNLIR